MKERVVITGLGIVCSAGQDCETFADAIWSGVSRLFPVEDERLAHYRGRYAGHVRDFSLNAFYRDSPLASHDLYVKFAAAAAHQALTSAGIAPARYGDALGLIFATCSGPMLTLEKYHELRIKGVPYAQLPEAFERKYYAAARILCSYFKISGLSTTVTTACSSSTAAIGIAADFIRNGVLTAALVGGSDTFSPTTFAGFEGLKAICSSQCAPFSKPIGMNLGEGSGFFVLERLSDALKRNATIYAEVAGYGMSNDAFHCTAPDATGRGQALAMERALRDAGCVPSDIGYINAHGTGTEANDKSETKALLRVFKETSGTIPVSSTKSMVGHCLGAAGAVELVACILARQRGVFPSTVNFKEPREGCSLDYIPKPQRPWTSTKFYMNNNFAFGGNNVSVVLSSFRQENPFEKGTRQSQKDPVVISSCGVVSPAGVGIDAFMSACKQGKALYSMEPVQGRTALCGRVPPFDEKAVSRRLDLRSMDNASRFAALAAKMALQDAQVPEHKGALADMGFYLSLSSGSTRAEAEHIVPLLHNNFQINQVQAFPYIVPNSIGGNVCRALGIQGHNTVFTGGMGSPIMAMAAAFAAIQEGHASSILCGAVDEILEADLIDAYALEKRSVFLGGIPSEGSAMFLLEKAGNGEKRGVTPLALICSMAFSTEREKSDSRDTSTDVLEKNIHNAMIKAGIDSKAIGSVCVPGSDKRLIQTLEKILGPVSERIVDISGVLGTAPGCVCLFPLAYELFTPHLEYNNEAKYILCVCSSIEGNNSVLIIKKGC